MKANNNLKRSILYYPTIKIPSNNWLRQSLLYWDEISSIVPMNYYDEKPLFDLGPDLEYLKSEGEFRCVNPYDLLKNNDFEIVAKFEEEFIEKIEQNVLGKIPSKDYKLTSNIHRNKINDSLIYNFLQPKGLVTNNEAYQDFEWYLFENNTALIYMSLLAKYLADVDPNYTIAGTDREEYNKINFFPVRKDGFSCYGINFNNLLPIPREDSSLSDILQFKRNRKDELINFRNIVDSYQAQISKADGRKEVKAITVKFSENLQKGLSDLTKVLKESNFSIMWSTFKTMIDIKSPAFIGTIGTIVNQSNKIVNIPLEYSVCGILISAAIEVGSKYIEVKNKKSAALRESPFSYLYSAKTEGIL